jgi:hypothetical protein
MTTERWVDTHYIVQRERGEAFMAARFPNVHVVRTTGNSVESPVVQVGTKFRIPAAHRFVAASRRILFGTA